MSAVSLGDIVQPTIAVSAVSSPGLFCQGPARVVTLEH